MRKTGCFRIDKITKKRKAFASRPAVSYHGSQDEQLRYFIRHASASFALCSNFLLQSLITIYHYHQFLNQSLINMKRFFLPFALSALLIASATTFSACQQQTGSVNEQQQESAVTTDVPAETSTGDVAEEKSEAIAKKEAAQAAAEKAEAIYHKSCSSCHSLTPPAKSAPPIIAIAGQYRARYGKKSGAVADMVSFMKEPSIGKSVFGSKTFERFGIMPVMSLPDKELEMVSEWLWDQYDPNFEGDADCQ